MRVIKADIHIEPHAVHLFLRDRFVLLLVELAGRIKDLFAVERLVHEPKLDAGAQRPPEQLLFVGILQVQMRILEQTDPFGKDNHSHPVIGLT